MINQTNSGFLNSILPVTENLIIINLLFWAASLALPKVGIDLMGLLGLHFPGVTDFKVYQIVSYMFMHDTHSFAHMFFNMFAVYMFGRVLENVWGPERFLIFYFAMGIGADLVQEVVWFFNLRGVIFADQDVVNLDRTQITNRSEFLNYLVTIGASGAVFGVSSAFVMIFPNVPSYLMLIPIPIKAKYFVIFYGLAELFMGVASFGGDTVAHSAHLRGMLFSCFLIRY